MARSLSSDLRERVVKAIAGGLSTRQAASRFGICISTAGKWYRRFRDHGETAARQQGHPCGSKLDAHADFILGLVEEQADITLAEIAERLSAERGLSAVVSTVWTFFARRGITFKKKTAHASEQQRADVQAARAAWRERQRELDPMRLVFVYETGLSTKMARMPGEGARVCYLSAESKPHCLR